MAMNVSSPAVQVQSPRSLAPALGLELAGRVRVAPTLCLYVGAAVLGILAGERFTARGETLLELTRLQVNAEAGLGVALW